jgi:hypothetical protein
MKWLVIGLVLAAGVRFGLVFFEETQLRGDTAMIPTFAIDNGLLAVNLANAARRAMSEHQCAEVPDSLTVTVGPVEEGASKMPTQLVDIGYRCVRRGVFFQPKELTVETHSRGLAAMGAVGSHYP